MWEQQIKLAELMNVTDDKDLLAQSEARMQGGSRCHSLMIRDALSSLASAEWGLGKRGKTHKKHLQRALEGKFPEHLGTAVALARMKLINKEKM